MPKATSSQPPPIFPVRWPLEPAPGRSVTRTLPPAAFSAAWGRWPAASAVHAPWSALIPITSVRLPVTSGCGSHRAGRNPTHARSIIGVPPRPHLTSDPADHPGTLSRVANDPSLNTCRRPPACRPAQLPPNESPGERVTPPHPGTRSKFRAAYAIPPGFFPTQSAASPSSAPAFRALAGKAAAAVTTKVRPSPHSSGSPLRHFPGIRSGSGDYNRAMLGSGLPGVSAQPASALTRSSSQRRSSAPLSGRRRALQPTADHPPSPKPLLWKALRPSRTLPSAPAPAPAPVEKPVRIHPPLRTASRSSGLAVAPAQPASHPISVTTLRSDSHLSSPPTATKSHVTVTH